MLMMMLQVRGSYSISHGRPMMSKQTQTMPVNIDTRPKPVLVDKPAQTLWGPNALRGVSFGT